MVENKQGRTGDVGRALFDDISPGQMSTLVLFGLVFMNVHINGMVSSSDFLPLPPPPKNGFVLRPHPLQHC